MWRRHLGVLPPPWRRLERRGHPAFPVCTASLRGKAHAVLSSLVRPRGTRLQKKSFCRNILQEWLMVAGLSGLGARLCPTCVHSRPRPRGSCPPQATWSPSGAETRLPQLRTSSLALSPTFQRRVSRPSPGPQGRGVHSVHGREAVASPVGSLGPAGAARQRGLQHGKGETLLERAVWVGGAISASEAGGRCPGASFPLTSQRRAPDSELTGAGLDLGTPRATASSHLEK